MFDCGGVAGVERFARPQRMLRSSFAVHCGRRSADHSHPAKTNPIGVAEYQLTEKLPKEFQGKLPSASELRMALLPDKSLPKQKTASKKPKRK